jgi:hypothetical protein
MGKIKLPVFKKPLPPSRSLSMDEYYEFDLFHLKYTFNKEEYEKQKRLSGVNSPFSL